MVYELLCNLIGSSTSRLSLHILLVVKKTQTINKMAERFANVNEQFPPSAKSSLALIHFSYR